MPTILIGGYYGEGNLGDEAILTAIIRDLRDQQADLSLIVTSWNPEKTRRESGVDAVHWKDVNGLIDAAQRSDLILLGGGGLFQDFWGMDPNTYLRKGYWDITAYGSLPLLAELLDIPCMICAVGVDRLHSDGARRHVRKAFERCQVATLRDAGALEFLRQTGFHPNAAGGPMVKILPDPVFSLTTTDSDDKQAGDVLRRQQLDGSVSLLGLSLRYWDFGMPMDEWLPRIADEVRSFLSPEHSVHAVLIPFQTSQTAPYSDDAAVLARLADLVDLPDRVHQIDEPLSPALAQALIKRCTVLLGMRLHSVIMGINARTPVVALAYAPKVRSAMHSAGLHEFCLDTLAPEVGILANRIRSAWGLGQAVYRDLQPQLKAWRGQTREHTRLALGLLSGSPRKPLRFAQEFALERARLLLQADDALAQQQGVIQTLQSQLTEQQSLSASLERELITLRSQTTEWRMRSDELGRVEASKIWKLANRYYRMRDETFLRHLFRFAAASRSEGTARALEKGVRFIASRLRPGRTETTKEPSSESSTRAERSLTAADTAATADPQHVVQRVVDALNGRSLRGVLVVTSTVTFDELVNQRNINLSKSFAQQGWGVIFMAWRWTRDEAMPGIGKEVHPNIFQIPKDMVLDHADILAQVHCPEKYFIIEFPHPDFLPCMLELRRYGYRIVYEIIDEWEEFNKVGQAMWFDSSVEEALVVNANHLTAVSQPLIAKFSRLRMDIHLLPNGFTPALLGSKHRNIARRTPARKDELHLGYYGYLSKAWFDWDFLLKVVDLAEADGINVFFHLIGYGEPDLETILSGRTERVLYHGKKHPSELHQHVRDWDGAFIWFKPGKLSESVDPIKIYEYLFFGLPVVVRGIPHLKRLPRVRMVDTEQQTVDWLIRCHANRRKAVRFDWRSQAAVDRLLAASTWDVRFTALAQWMEKDSWMSF